LVAVNPPIMGPADTDVGLVGSVTTIERVVAAEEEADRRPSLFLLTNVDADDGCCCRMLAVVARDVPVWGCHLHRSAKGNSKTSIG
jgi:hypothetical protein